MRTSLTAIGVTILLAIATNVLAQGLPPHAPGTICITPSGWCWVDRGAVGEPCGCATTNGYIEGTHG